MLAVTAGAGFVGVTNDYRSLFDEDNPQLAALNALEDTYGPSNRALIAIAPLNGSAFTRETLAAVEELTEAAWKAPHATRVDSLTNYSHSRADGDELIVAPLVEEAGALTDADLERIAATALNAVEISGRLVSRDGKVAGLVIDFALPDNPDAAVVEITDYLNGVLDAARARDPGIAYYLTGDVPLNRAFADATRDDLETLAPIVFAIIAVMAAVLLRSLLGTVAIVAVLMFVINTTVGFAGWIGTVFNPANSGVPIIVMTVAVAHSVHIVETTLAGLSRGLDRNAAIAESIRVNAWPVFLTSLTTIIGFLSLNASDLAAVSRPRKSRGLRRLLRLRLFAHSASRVALRSFRCARARFVAGRPGSSTASAPSWSRAGRSCSGAPPSSRSFWSPAFPGWS